MYHELECEWNYSYQSLSRSRKLSAVLPQFSRFSVKLFKVELSWKTFSFHFFAFTLTALILTSSISFKSFAMSSTNLVPLLFTILACEKLYEGWKEGKQWKRKLLWCHKPYDSTHNVQQLSQLFRVHSQTPMYELIHSYPLRPDTFVTSPNPFSLWTLARELNKAWSEENWFFFFFFTSWISDRLVMASPTFHSSSPIFLANCWTLKAETFRELSLDNKSSTYILKSIVSRLWAPEILAWRFTNKTAKIICAFNILHLVIAPCRVFVIKILDSPSLTTLKLKYLRPRTLWGTESYSVARKTTRTSRRYEEREDFQHRAMRFASQTPTCLAQTQSHRTNEGRIFLRLLFSQTSAASFSNTHSLPRPFPKALPS